MDDVSVIWIFILVQGGRYLRHTFSTEEVVGLFMTKRTLAQRVAFYGRSLLEISRGGKNWDLPKMKGSNHDKSGLSIQVSFEINVVVLLDGHLSSV